MLCNMLGKEPGARWRCVHVRGHSGPCCPFACPPMRKDTGNIWTVSRHLERLCDAVVIPTNGIINRHGEAVMGRGLARQAAQRWPGLPRVLAAALLAGGNHVYDVYRPRGLPTLITFPVKRHWHLAAEPALIEQSCVELIQLVDRLGFHDVALPRVGCGNGQLKWVDIRPILERYLDSRFILVSLPSEVQSD